MNAAPFDAATADFVGSHEEGCQRLQSDTIELLGVITSASNGTMLCRLGDTVDNLFAIYKPGQHERPLWDFPGRLFHREVAAYEVSEFLGWGIVPPTVLRDGPLGPGSLQLFVPHDPVQHYFTLVEDDVWDTALARMAMFDMVINNADRKGGHVLRSTREERLYGIDNGLTFHVESKLRTVVWDVPHVSFQGAWRADLTRLQQCLRGDEVIRRRLDELLTIAEVQILARRARHIAGLAAVPDVDPDRRWYPWPPI